jgi:hypothetical protein
MHQGLPCSKGMLGSTALDECCPPSSFVTMVSFLGEKSLTTTVPTCDDNLIKDFTQDLI